MKNIAFGADIPNDFEDENTVTGFEDDFYDADIEESLDGVLFEQEDGFGIKWAAPCLEFPGLKQFTDLSGIVLSSILYQLELCGYKALDVWPAVFIAS